MPDAAAGPPVRPHPDLTQMRTRFPRGVAIPALRALAAAGHDSLDSLDGASIAALRALHGMGPRAIDAIQEALAARNRTLRP